MEEVLRLAIQSKGRLSEDSIQLVKECGIKLNNGVSKLKSTSHNFPIEFLFLRDDDIPDYVADGVADIGIIGENVAEEKGKDIDIVKRLGFSKCRLSLALLKSEGYSGPEYFEGKKIATSYPNILRKFLKSKNIKAEIHEISGSVEIAPGIGLADGICDIVSSGSTLISNGLKEVEVIFNSEAVMISNRQLSEGKKEILDQLVFRLESVRNGKNNKYILLNAPNESIEEIIKILPGMKSPTVLPLAQPGWSSIHSAIKEEDFWDRIDMLKKVGAQGILVVPIEKMIL